MTKEYKMKDISIKLSSASVGLSIENLMEKIKPVVTEKNQFEKQKKPQNYELFSVLLSVKSLMQNANLLVSQSKVSPALKSFRLKPR